MEAAALNFLSCTVAGGQEGPLLHAQLFSLHEVPVDNIEEKLAEAVAWATDPVIDIPELKNRSLEHRYGYRATLDAAMATVAAHWNAWQSIVEQVIVTPALSLDGPEVDYREYGKHTTIAAGPLLHIKAASNDVRLTSGLAPSVVPSVAKSSIAPRGKGASNAKAETGRSKPSWNASSWGSEDWGSEWWAWNSYYASPSAVEHWWTQGDNRSWAWEECRPEQNIVNRPIVGSDQARPMFASHCWQCAEIQHWDYELEHHLNVDRAARMSYHTLAQTSRQRAHRGYFDYQ